jgi:hypothetical protein
MRVEHAGRCVQRRHRWCCRRCGRNFVQLCGDCGSGRGRVCDWARLCGRHRSGCHRRWRNLVRVEHAGHCVRRCRRLC